MNQPPNRSARSRRRIAASLILLAVILVVWGIASRLMAEASLQRRTDTAAVPTVSIMTAASGPDGEELVLPGTVRANYEAPIYARASGYLKQWYTDIGARVRAGQLLALIDTPDLDDQLHQAEADLRTAEANDTLARSTAVRWQNLLKTDSVSRQETDEKVSDAAAKEAAMAAARANVARLRQLEDFRRVTAPFDGVVTARETDIGALINAGSGVGPELFRVADNSKLRIYVQVPQTYVASITPGLKVSLVFAEYPGRRFEAALVSTAQALDPSARTLLIELQADNADGLLLPGGFTEVHLALAEPITAIRLPASALLFRAEGLRVATVDAANRVHMHEVSLGRDFGDTVEVLRGILPGDRVVTNPPDSVEDGEAVAVVAPFSRDRKLAPAPATAEAGNRP